MPEQRIITAAEMDLMTPADRAAAVEAGTVTSLEDLPNAVRVRIEAKAAELRQRLRTGNPA